MTKEQIQKIIFALDAINQKENLYGDNIAKVEQYDGSIDGEIRIIYSKARYE